MNENPSQQKRRARGMMLFEVLIVVAILAMIAAGVSVGAMTYWEKARIENARANAAAIRNAVKTFSLEHGSAECPSTSA